MMLLSKPQLAEDWNPEKVKFPVMVQPKVDGVRGLNLFGRLSARSLRPFDNKHATLFFSQGAFLGLDGEMAAEHETNESLCRLTTSALNTIAGEPWLMWHVFDYLRPDTVELPYHIRYDMLVKRVEEIKAYHPELGAHLHLMPSVNHVHDMTTLECLIQDFAEAGYEGTIIRNPFGLHKNGRSSPAHRGLLRIKAFCDVDCIVLKINEGQTNMNEAKINRLGLTERSTHAENMVPNGMIGSMDCELLEDVFHPLTRKLVHRKGEPIRLSAGCMTHDERRLYFQSQHLINGKRVKGRLFPVGVKEKPRHPRFQSFRADADVVSD